MLYYTNIHSCRGGNLKKNNRQRTEKVLDTLLVEMAALIPQLLEQCEPEVAAKLAVQLVIALKPPRNQEQDEDEGIGLIEVLRRARQEAEETSNHSHACVPSRELADQESPNPVTQLPQPNTTEPPTQAPPNNPIPRPMPAPRQNFGHHSGSRILSAKYSPHKDHW